MNSVAISLGSVENTGQTSGSLTPITTVLNITVLVRVMTCLAVSTGQSSAVGSATAGH